MESSFYKRKVQRVECPICKKVIRITSDIVGMNKGHTWGYEPTEGRIIKGHIVYPLVIICKGRVSRI